MKSPRDYLLKSRHAGCVVRLVTSADAQGNERVSNLVFTDEKTAREFYDALDMGAVVASKDARIAELEAKLTYVVGALRSVHADLGAVQQEATEARELTGLAINRCAE